MEWSLLLVALLGLIGLGVTLLLVRTTRARRKAQERDRLRRAELFKRRLQESGPPLVSYHQAEIEVHQGTQVT
jgi:hypothetical protein